MKKKIIYSGIEEMVYQFDEGDIEKACKSQMKEDLQLFDNRFRMLYGDCGEFKGVEIRVLVQKLREKKDE